MCDRGDRQSPVAREKSRYKADTVEPLGDLTIVGVGASAGGLEAIREMLAPARRHAPFAYVVVQHLDPNHESMLAELLSRHTELEVQQVVGGEEVSAGHVYIIPPGRGLRIRSRKLELTDFDQPRGLRRPIDDFFESLAVDGHEMAVCVILSGNGADGSSGLRAIKEHGGICIAQDSSARYDGMPTSAVATGLVDLVCAPADIFGELVRLRSGKNRPGDGDNVLDFVGDLCRTLRSRLGHDFTGYKHSTLARRVERRMQVLGVTDSRAYLDRIEQDSEECETLFRDFLINVTRFFRDPVFFDILRRRAVAPLVEAAESDSELRIWVPGCSSGEEAYSIAMLFAREIKLRKKDLSFQIFATDIDEAMLDIARAGIYPSAALADIPEEFRDSYTIGRDASFQIAPAIRDSIRFSVHSVIKDPPFSRLDLISCRNLLIYFGEKLQTATLPIFHYALNPQGYLFLGPSENISRTEDLFTPVDQKARLFRRDRTPATYPIDMPGAIVGRSRRQAARRATGPTEGDIRRNIAAQRVLDRYAPATLQVNRQGQILSSTGQLAKYLTLDPSGQGPVFAQSAARSGLSETISALLWKAAHENRRTIARGMQVVSEFGTQTVDVIAEPLGDETQLLVFHETAPFAVRSDEDMDELNAPESHVLALEDELRMTRAQLRATVEELGSGPIDLLEAAAAA
ncbi:hypothetical protein OU426_15880 [Frigidibacter sp. RF13]|uniref:CheR family methyltransferase n=1 Tax=Frigidibacter sp. RF13 TaxID=2997340 RepID=UPI00226F4F1A|nr:CheR family methyltransferase [Frigidibacter sp. RF13]MCY1128344.1 hypothetical protein [Frigidibacter sp. RF13]